MGYPTDSTAADSSAPLTIPYIHNHQSSQQHGDFGERFAQHVEPHGRYLVERSGDHVPEGWESGEVTFHNPKHMDFGGDYTEPSNWKHRLSAEYGGKRGKPLSRALLKAGHDGIVTHDEGGTREIVDLTPLRRQAAMVLPEGYHREYPETWGTDYHSYAQESPHAAAIGQAQEHMRMHVPTWTQPLPDEQSATGTARFMLGKAGHPRADTADVMHHPHPEKGTSNTFRRSDGDVGVVLHPDRFDYGTMAHELAHLTHQHELGVHSGAGLSDEELHGPGFMKHYRRMADLVSRGAGDKLHQEYQHALGRIQSTQKEARAVLPSQRLFGPTYGLDHRLFDGDKLRPEVRKAIIAKFANFCDRHHYWGAWGNWAKIVFFGSEASTWTSPDLEGNNDFDLSIGIEYDRFRELVPVARGVSDELIANALTEEMHAELNDPDTFYELADGSRIGPFDQTWFANLLGWDIRQIRPYAAYDVVRNHWIVEPPQLPDWDISKFPEGHGLVREIQGIIEMARGILSMPEPYRTQNGDALWHFIHDNRSGAFGPQGEGWFDARNVIEKALDQKGLIQQLWNCHDRADHVEHSLDAPAGWSNDPGALR